MSKPKPDNRYDMRREEDDTWTVYDIMTGLPAVVNGTIGKIEAAARHKLPPSNESP